MKWRRFNLGGSKPSDVGLYYSWGNPQGHALGSGYDFSQEVYNETPGAAIAGDITLENDMAHIALGGSARLPNVADLNELIDNCTNIWTTLDGIHGHLLTSNINGQVLFIPVVGCYNGTSLLAYDASGHYWTSERQADATARNLWLQQSQIVPSNGIAKYFGCSVRPVWDENPNRSIVPPVPEDEPKDEETPTQEEPKDKDER